MSKMSEDDLLQFLRAEQDAAWEFSDGALASAREQAMRAYLREPYGNEEEGRSAVVASDVFDTVEGMLPDLVETFVSSDKAVVFDPQNAEDVEAAKQATNACNYVFYRQNSGFLVLYSALKDALLLRNGGVKWFWEVKRTPDFATYRGVDEIQLAAHLAANPDAEVTEQEEYEPTPEEQQQAAAMGAQMPPRFTVKIKTVKQRGRVRVVPVPPHELQVSRRHNSVMLDECPYVAHVREVTLSDLRQMGYDVDEDDVKAARHDRATEDEVSRRPGWLRDDDSKDPAQTRGWLREEYVLCDYDGDGIAERRKVMRLGEKVLENTEFSHVPLACWTPYILTHRFHGVSVADLVEEFQRVSTEIWRAQLDNLQLANNQETVVTTNAQGAPLANIDDLLNRRPGGIIREQVQGAVRPYVERWQGIEAMPMVELLQSSKENRTGWTRYSQGMDGSSLNKTAHGIQQIMNASQKRQKLMCRIAAEAMVAPMFRGIFKTLSDYCMEKLSFRLNGSFVSYDPQEWRDQFDMTVNVGIGTGDVQQQAAMLQQIAAAQFAVMQTPVGAQLVDAQTLHATQARICENAGFKNPGEFWKDPATSEPPQMPPPPDPTIVKTQMTLQADAQKTQATMQTDAQKFQAQLAFDAQQAQLDRESKERIEMAKLQFQYASKQADMDSAQQPDLQQMLQPLAQQMQTLAQEVAQALQELHGRIEGGKTAGIEKLRGPDGRVIGGRIAYADGTTRDVSIQ
jgi:hypothetical protein